MNTAGKRNRNRTEPNRHRVVPELVGEDHYGQVSVAWGEPAQIEIALRTADGRKQQQVTLNP